MLTTLRGKDIITSQFLPANEIEEILSLAYQMKRDRWSSIWDRTLYKKTFLMFFYNPSVRTRISFETAMTELGGHAIYLTPTMGRFKDVDGAGESIEDAAQVMSRFVAGIGLRIEDKGAVYGDAHAVLLEYAKWASVPVINMADDRFHPCQGFSDLMGWAEWLGNGVGEKPNFEKLKGKKLLVTWAKGKLHRSRTSPQESMLLASRFGMNITLARPDGYDLDPEVYGWINKNCEESGGEFEIINDPYRGYDDAHVVYSRNWISEEAYNSGLQKQEEVQKASSYSDWMATPDKMARTNSAIFTHPMPVDRENEVSNSIASGKRSAIYDIAENRLHVQKAILALTMGGIDL